MNISKKQISLGVLAAVAIVAVPTVTAISCGKSDTKKSEKGGNADVNSTATIDLAKLNSVSELVESINVKLGLAMAERVDLLAAMDDQSKLKEESFNKIKKYMDGMNPNNLKKLIVKSGNKQIEWDLKDLLSQVQVVKDSIAKGYSSIKENPVISLASEVPSAGGMLTALSSDSNTQFTYGIALTGFSELEGKGYKGYNGILKAYHSFATKITSSNFFKEWIKNKEYELIDYKYDAPQKAFTITDTIKYKAGEGFDDSATRVKKLPGIVNSPKFKTEGNNFEAQWIIAILKMK